MQNAKYLKPPVVSKLGQKWLAKIEAEQAGGHPELLARKQKYIANHLKRQGAIDAVERIMKYGCTEKKMPLHDSIAFRETLRLVAEQRLRSTTVSGASQIFKTLSCVLVLADCLIYGQIDVGYFFDSRDNLYNNQPQQIQPILENYIQKLGEGKEGVKREATARFNFGIASGYFFYVTGQSKESQGGAAESSKVASVSISAAWKEEFSSWGNVDISPRLGASCLISRPEKNLGTPGSGNGGVERAMKSATHIFAPAVTCHHCHQLTFLDPKGALLKSVPDPRTGRSRYFNGRGQILDYWSKDGTPETAYVACTHCGSEVTIDQIAECHLHCTKTKISAEQFLDELPEDEVYSGSVAIYLSPLLRMPTDPLRAVELVRQGLEPENPAIYQQNKLGHASETSSDGISVAELDAIMAMEPWDFSDLQTLRN